MHFSALLAVNVMLFAFSALLLDFGIATISGVASTFEVVRPGSRSGLL